MVTHEVATVLRVPPVVVVHEGIGEERAGGREYPGPVDSPGGVVVALGYPGYGASRILLVLFHEVPGGLEVVGVPRGDVVGPHVLGPDGSAAVGVRALPSCRVEDRTDEPTVDARAVLEGRDPTQR